MVGFRLANTLSENGAVSRGVCTVSPEGGLNQVVETSGIRASEVGRTFSGDEMVSMNCWGFLPAVFPLLDAQWKAFLDQTLAGPTESKAEFYLPGAISTAIAANQLRVRVLPTDSHWFGVTYREDKPRVATAIAALVQNHTYPEKLWS
jgi:hypothetical protein